MLIVERGKNILPSEVPDMYLTTHLGRTMCRLVGACMCLAKNDIKNDISGLVHMERYNNPSIRDRYRA